METKHTSGPWTLKRNEHDLTGRKGLKGWDLIAQPSTTFPGAIECAGQYIGNEANARLIAAAPDGLAANIKARDAILDLLGSGMVSTDGSLIAALRDAMNECNVAIAKATGKTL